MIKYGYVSIIVISSFILQACHNTDALKQDMKRLEIELKATKKELDTTNQKLEKLSRHMFLINDRVESNQVEISRTTPPKKLKVVTLKPEQKKLENVPKQEIPPTFYEKKPPAKQTYENALRLYRAKQYDDAEVAFMKFLNYYPNHDYSDNAYFWMGECHFDRKNYSSAIESYVTVLDKYPQGNKVPWALLKLALSYEKVGKQEETLMTLKELIATYPRSDATVEAKKELRKIDPTAG